MNVGRLHRVLKLLTILQGGTRLSADDLAAQLGVSRRTLFRDLKMLEAAGIPYYHENGVGYRVSPSFFLPPVNLKVTEALGLMTLAKSAEAHRHQPLAAPTVEAVQKLMAMMPQPFRQVITEMMGRVSIHPAAAVSPALNHHDHYALLQQAIDESRIVRMRYHSLFDGGEVDLVLHPYHLHFATRAWYVIGRCTKTKQNRTYKIARIRDLKLTDRRFTPPADFSIDDYLGKAWQLIPEGKIHRIELEFTAKVGTNVSEIHWHPTQHHDLLPDGRCIMRFEVDGLNEISWWLLGYGDQVIVRKPAALRRRMIEFHRSALDRYQQADKS